MKSLRNARTLFSLGLIGLALCSPVFAGSGPAVSTSSDESAAKSPQVPAPISDEGITIPGPLRPFLRMAGISQKISREEVLPLLARNVFSIGYTRGRPTEFLSLLSRYVHQARELEAMAGPGGVVHIAKCDEAGPLLHILGYRLRQSCGTPEATLVTADAEKAFITIDSGFPLPELEEALQKGGPFTYAFASTHVPMLFTEGDWRAASKEAAGTAQDLVDTLLHDPGLARLYWAMSRSDVETRIALRQAPGLGKLLPFAGILDFYGGYICIRSGRVVVPGGLQAEPGWRELVGASPEAPGEFVSRLLEKDKGWLAAYFDVLSRINQTQQAHFTEPSRLKRFYTAFRSPAPSLDAAKQTFRPAPALLLLVTRLQWESDDQPHIPGNLGVWREILRQSDSKVAHEWAKRAAHWNRPEQLLEAMFSLSRQETDIGPVQIYLTLSELDRERPQEKPLSPKTVLLLASKFSKFSSQYLVFSEFPDLSDESIERFLNVAEAVDRTANHPLRGNAMGSFQANVGLWQILARQGQIPRASLNESWDKVIEPFAKIATSTELFDATRESLAALMRAATGKPDCSQDEIGWSPPTGSGRPADAQGIGR